MTQQVRHASVGTCARLGHCCGGARAAPNGGRRPAGRPADRGRPAPAVPAQRELRAAVRHRLPRPRAAGGAAHPLPEVAGDLAAASPYAVLAVTTAAAILHLALGFKPTFAEAAMVVSLYTVAAHRPRRQAVVGALAFAAAMVGYGLIAQARYPSPFQDSLQAWVLTFIQFAAAFFLGEAQKRRLGYMAQLEELNLQLAEEQELRSRWAVAAERSRIARELHDVVAHSVSVMVVQAGAARRTVAASPGQAATALGQIESTGRQAWSSCAGCWGCCATTTARQPMPPSPPSRAWPTSSRWPPRPARPACRSK